MRGKRTSSPRCGIGGRIIPARAGQTTIPRAERFPKTDHPRACGANPMPRLGTAGQSGSSPRVRGKPLYEDVGAGQRRIIPARAGQTCSGSGSRRAGTDHPRACGANGRALVRRERAAGSSPRVRGKLKQRFRIWKRGSDHPRACGANVERLRRPCIAAGSSPRVRGKPVSWPATHCTDRIIPARAGQTLVPFWFPVSDTDHPRACGANSKTA